MSPVFSVTSNTVAPLVFATRRLLLRQPRPRQRQLLSPPCQKPPDNLLLRARPHACGCLSFHLCALDSSAVKPVTSIKSTARRRPPPPNLNHRHTRSCAAPTPEPNDRWRHPRSPAPLPSSLNRRPGRALHCFFPGLHAAPLLAPTPLPFPVPAAIKGNARARRSSLHHCCLPPFLLLPAQAPTA